jgi:hypothetical protein
VPRSFEIVTESLASVDQVHAAFSREDYWLARLAAFGDASTLDSLVVDADGTVTVNLTQHLDRRLLPAAVVKFVPDGLKIVRAERWRPVGEQRVCGQVSVSAPGGLGSGCAQAWLTPAGNGSQLRFDLTVEVKIPLLGGKLENSIGAQLTQNIPAFQRFTAEWIAQHA